MNRDRKQSCELSTSFELSMLVCLLSKHVLWMWLALAYPADSLPQALQSSSRLQNRSSKNRTLIISAATLNASWTRAVTENHALWAARVANSDYMYVEDRMFGALEHDDELTNRHDSPADELAVRPPSSPLKHSPPSQISLSTGASRRLQPHWLKIHLLQKMMSQRSDYSHILWVDDDIVFTSRNNVVEALYKKMDRDTHLIIAMDIGHGHSPSLNQASSQYVADEASSKQAHEEDDTNFWRQVNTGFMFFRISPESKALLSLVWEQRMSSLGFCENQSCLHEQEALNNVLWDSGTKLWDTSAEPSDSQSNGGAFERSNRVGSEVLAREVVKVLEPYDSQEPELNFNTVWRLTHTWKGQLLPRNYNGDPLQRRWHWGDNMAHVSGMTRSCRTEMIYWLTEYVKRNVFSRASSKNDHVHSVETDEGAIPEDGKILHSPLWYPPPLSECARTSDPSGGGNWVLPRRGALDLDAALVGQMQGTFEHTPDLSSSSGLLFLGSDESGASEAKQGTKATLLLSRYLLYGDEELPALNMGLLDQLSDTTMSGIERYRNMILHAVKSNCKYFGNVDPETFNAFGGVLLDGHPCSARSQFENAFVSLPSSNRTSSKDGSVALFSHRVFRREIGDDFTPQFPYVQLSFAAVAQNPEVFRWVSPLDFSFIEYHNLALGAVLQQPEQLAHVEATRYLEMAGTDIGGQAYYDLAFEAVSIHGSALQYVQKVLILGQAYREWVARKQKSPDLAPRLLPPPSSPLTWAGSLPLAIVPRRRSRNAQNMEHVHSLSDASFAWPWEVINTLHMPVVRHGRTLTQRNYFQLALAAVSQDGFALEFVSIEDLSSPEEYFIVAEAAVAQNGRAFAFVNKSVVGGAMGERYYELALKAVHDRGEAFWEVDTGFLTDVELMVLVLKAIKNGDPAAFKAFNAREPIKQVKGLYTELALLALSGVGFEAFRGSALRKDLRSDASNSQQGPSSASLARIGQSSTVGVLDFVEPGRIVGAKARHALAEAALRQDGSADVWEQVEDMFGEGIRRDDLDQLRATYRATYT
eukprot:TRINITY_DN28724_c0_g1_i1.p1 TRINITY_DN28724_c0_g1~~TRINITY_DN28724_c0_g1_i1.p1  ORF type:complete len:1041 (-),score=82.77 TRINITY_DN28724_c0_g1_i1:289-3411(-)